MLLRSALLDHIRYAFIFQLLFLSQSFLTDNFKIRISTLCIIKFIQPSPCLSYLTKVEI